MKKFIRRHKIFFFVIFVIFCCLSIWSVIDAKYLYFGLFNNPNEFTIISSSGPNGSISPDGIVKKSRGSNQSYDMVPASHFHVLDVKVDGVSQGPMTSIELTNIQTDHNVSVSFSINKYTLRYSSGANGSIDGELVQSVPYGDDGQRVTARADAGYEFGGWSDGALDASRIDLGVGSSISVTANFIPVASSNTSTTTLIAAKSTPTVSSSTIVDSPIQYTITSSAGDNGSISPLGSTTKDYGSSQTYTITPNLHYHVVDVTVDGSSQGAITSYEFTNIQASHSIGVTFAIDTYSLSYAALINGSIFGDASQVVNYGASGTEVIATPNTGYYFSSWSDGILTASRTDVTVTEDISVTASFAINQYTITSSAGDNGSISPLGVITKNYASSQEYVITPDEGYLVDDVVVNGESVGELSVYEFTNIIENQTIEVTFVAISTVTIDSVVSNSGYNTIDINIDSINGSGFVSGLTVKLVKSGQQDIVCTGMTVTSSSLISDTNCDITSVQSGGWDVVITNSDSGSGTLSAGFTVMEYELGDMGPAGGYIFYINENYLEDGWRYMEAAPVDQSTGAWWSDNITDVMGASGTAVGTGPANTAAVTGSFDPASSAIELANNYILDDYSDWFLPSKDELDLMYDELRVKSIGGFATSGSYWSSSEVSGTNSTRQSFSTGLQSSSLKSQGYRVRLAHKTPIYTKYNVTYDGNDNDSGSAPIDPKDYLRAANVTVANVGSLQKSGYTFVGWNTVADGSGTNYDGGDTFSMPANDVTLYAQWYRPSYSFVVLPDTQSYVAWAPEVMTSQLDWLVANRGLLNLQFVSHVGDIVQEWDQDEPEWVFVKSEMDKLTTAVVPYSTSVGNHDYADGTRNNIMYNTYFPLSNFNTMDTFGGSYDSNSENSYHILEGDANNDDQADDQVLIISLEFGPREAVINWANDILEQYSDMKAIIVTHAYLRPDGGLLTHTDNHAASNGYGLGDDVNDGDEIWTKLIYPNANVKLVICGHDGTTTVGAALRVANNINDEPVYQMMANYQYFTPSQAGHLLMFQFSNSGATFKTYSPYKNSYVHDAIAEGEFDWSFDAPD